MAERTISLTSEERRLLLEMLEVAHKETLVEEHRTRSPSFREHISQREELIDSLLHKLREPAGV